MKHFKRHNYITSKILSCESIVLALMPALIASFPDPVLGPAWPSPSSSCPKWPSPAPPQALNTVIASLQLRAQDCQQS